MEEVRCKMKRTLLFLLFYLLTFLPLPAKVIKVLAIGNSFSQDGVEQYLYELAEAQGDSLIIGNAYIGGCSIDRHYENLLTGKAEYEYRKVVGGIRSNKRKVGHQSACGVCVAHDMGIRRGLQLEEFPSLR